MKNRPNMLLVKRFTNLMLEAHQFRIHVTEVVHATLSGMPVPHKKVPEHEPDFLKMSLAQPSPAPFSFLHETTLS